MRCAVIEPGSTTVRVVESPQDRLSWYREVTGAPEIDFTTLRRFTPDPETFPRVQMVMDDLALFRDPPLPVNHIGMRLYNPDPEVLIQHGMDPHPIVGTIILTAYDEMGDTVDLPFAALDVIRQLGFTVEVTP